MLKHRIILGLILGLLFVGLIVGDSHASKFWPQVAQATPPGFFVALLSLIVIPLALREMRALLARQNVHISMRITVVAAILCMLWPWIEQVSESIYAYYDMLSQTAAVPRGWMRQLGPLVPTEAKRAEMLQALQASPWYTIGGWFRSFKPHYLVPTVLALSLVAAVVKHSRHQRVEGTMANAGGTLLAIVYLGVLPSFFLPICLSYSAWMMLAVCAIVKCADIGAYVTGRMIGRHKLIPWLSPGKTVEGFFGGVAFSALVGGVIAGIHGMYPWWMGALSGAILGAVGQVGDLLESLLKRDAGVKDSGKVPGFGGVLDILDSPLLAAPVAYWLLKLAPTSGGFGS